MADNEKVKGANDAVELGDEVLEDVSGGVGLDDDTNNNNGGTNNNNNPPSQQQTFD